MEMLRNVYAAEVLLSPHYAQDRRSLNDARTWIQHVNAPASWQNGHLFPFVGSDWGALELT
jgi:hypothetical protein